MLFKNRISALLGGLAALTNLALSAPTPAEVDIQFDRSIQTIPEDFSGLSFESKVILPDEEGRYLFSAENKALVEAFKTLGIRNLRIGGNTAERVSVEVPGLVAIDNLFAFARAADVQVIYTVRMEQYNPEKAASIVSYIERNYRDLVSCYIIGNEPDKDRSYETFMGQWTKFAEVITSEGFAPDARFCAPTTTHGAAEWAAQMAEDLDDTTLLKMVGQHYYPSASSLRFTGAELAREDLLLKNNEQRYRQFSDRFVPRLQKLGMPYRLNETNSFYGGGAYGASDTFASALWGLDYLFWWAKNEAIGINFHSGIKVYPGDMVTRKNVYTPITPTADGMMFLPLSYALKMFDLGNKGRLLEAEVFIRSESADYLTAYPVLGADGHVYLTLINKSYGEFAEEVNVSFDAQGLAQDVEVMTLSTRNDRIGNVHESMINGERIGEDASFTEIWESRTLPVEQGKLSIDVGPASAVLVKLKKS